MALRDDDREWRAARDVELRAADGWLSVVGLYWLTAAAAVLGADPAADIALPGAVAVVIGDLSTRLEALAAGGDPDSLQIVFRDRTAGRSTYGAGRFLFTRVAPDGAVTLDFNRAVSPPCAFTPYATCPLPPPANVLPIMIPAGETYRA